MDNKKFDPDKTGNPGKVYDDELREKGTTFTDTPRESDARDRAKIEKAATGQSQKIDGGNPDAEEDSVNNEEIRRETLENK
ncbi:MAG: hypothetical protein ACJ749_12450 [Flavisolibacter sp.]